MALHSKVALLVLASISAGLAPAADFRGSERIMNVLLTHLDKAQAALDAGNVNSAMAYAQSVMMDREEKVFLDMSHVDAKVASTAGSAFRDGLKMWCDSLPNAANISYVDSPSQADVIVEFSPTVVSEGMNVAGNIQWTRSVGPESDGQVRASVKAIIQVRTERPGSRQPMKFELIRHTCAHEIGHLLGMSDSYRVGDLMGPLDLNAPVTHLSDEELAAIRELRDRAAKVRLAAFTLGPK